MLDPDHPFFAAAWRRWAVVGVCTLWALMEASRGAWIWAAGAGAAGAYAAWALLLSPKARRSPPR
ncbi:hypothetical protein [Jannaschia seohaensis]|uniref:DUF3329 domain-containing protein n=1 Tax=Jannaschia seohaensis TaxID=475081 RepID=A0A2Y9ANN1_9RHOB|nr:hypothetical protein [Jannaschia seohaensis]PWJ19409.1 hypothetical protein BCF38_104346 [Jannaschia seohaensis]SSA46071.1 hypothetical protein SAMN05421539_104346 [Jannaschia seohaensis]